MEKLPETRLQLAQCDGYRFFTDDKAWLREPVHDLTRVKVPEQIVDRFSGDWLNHKNMAALTPVWVHLLRSGIAEKFDWVLHVELDHFTRPSMVRLAIAETLETLRTGSEWERSFFVAKDPVATAGAGLVRQGAHAGVQLGPMMLAFGNAYIFSRALVGEMKRQWPLPGLAADHGCPTWSVGHCEQDMVYPKMMGYFRPPVQIFGPSGCGKVQRSWGGKTLPLGCWEFFQNPSELGPEHQTEKGQRKALMDIAAGSKGRLPSVSDHPAGPTTPRLLNITDTEGEDTDTKNLLDEKEGRKWEGYLPPKKIPILHHAVNSAVLKEARLRLGL